MFVCVVISGNMQRKHAPVSAGKGKDSAIESATLKFSIHQLRYSQVFVLVTFLSCDSSVCPPFIFTVFDSTVPMCQLFG